MAWEEPELYAADIADFVRQLCKSWRTGREISNLDPVCVRTNVYSQVLASRNTAAASKDVFVASSLGVYGCPCSSQQVIASTIIAETRSGTNASENGWAW